MIERQSTGIQQKQSRKASGFEGCIGHMGRPQQVDIASYRLGMLIKRGGVVAKGKNLQHAMKIAQVYNCVLPPK